MRTVTEEAHQRARGLSTKGEHWPGLVSVVSEDSSLNRHTMCHCGAYRIQGTVPRCSKIEGSRPCQVS